MASQLDDLLGEIYRDHFHKLVYTAGVGEITRRTDFGSQFREWKAVRQRSGLLKNCSKRGGNQVE